MVSGNGPPGVDRPDKGPTTERPEIRAALVKSDLSSARALEAAPRILAAISPATVKRGEEAFTSAWLPLELDLEITQAVFREMGEEAVRVWSRTSIAQLFEGPLLRPLTDAGIKAFGATPQSWIKWFPRLWPSVLRNCGELSIAESGERSAVIRLCGAPRAILDSPPFLRSLCGACEGAILFVRAVARVEYRLEKDGTGVFRADWQ